MIIFEGLGEDLKNRIQAGDEAAESELYEVMRKALIRMVDPDTLHDAYVAVLVACRRGDVESVGGYVFRSLWYMRCKKIREYLSRKSLRSSCKSAAKKKKISVLDDDHQVEYSIVMDPMAEQESMSRSIVLDELLSILGSKGNTWERGEALLRMYADGCSRGDIQRRMNLTATSYRLLKNRAKDRLVQISRKIDRSGMMLTGARG